MDENKPFDRMSERVTRNADSFGGACVIVFPPMNGVAIDPVEILILDPKSDLAQFLATLQTRMAVIRDNLDSKQRTPFGR